jgi:hypothetical protein
MELFGKLVTTVRRIVREGEAARHRRELAGLLIVEVLLTGKSAVST